MTRESGIPEKIVKIIKKTYDEYEYQLMRQNKLLDPSKQVYRKAVCCSYICCSPIIFLMVVDRVMKKFNEKRKGTRSNMTMYFTPMTYVLFRTNSTI